MTDNHVIAVPQAGFWRKLWRISTPYFVSEEWRSACGLLVAVLVLVLGGIYIDVQINEWNRDFYNCLQQKDLTPTPLVVFGHELFVVNLFLYLIGKFLFLAFIWIILTVYAIYLRQILQLRWRRWMTASLTQRWLSDRSYYRLQLIDYGTDNPEQRIQADIDSFTSDTLRLSVGITSNAVTLVTFFGILWGLSGPLTFSLGSLSIYIPGYMVWGLMLYALAGSVITYVIGKPLIVANFDQERFGADFRYRMTRIRENAESIALYRGESREAAGLEVAFSRIWSNWWRLMILTKRLNWFGSFYGQLAVIFPFVLAAPRYFSGAIDLGTMFQIVSAFRQVKEALSWFIDAYQSLASWKATTNRLVTFVDALEKAEADSRDQSLSVDQDERPTVTLSAAEVAIPTGRALLHNVRIEIARGDKVLISGPSGSGKTTLFRVLAGLWPFAKGRLTIPTGARVLFLSQKPYLPLGTLREVVAFPAEPGAFTDDEIRTVLEDVRLSQLIPRLDEDANWSMTLSVGEQQRVAIARALLNKPDWLFMDEATSALDEENEAHAYALVNERLPGTALVSIAHRPAVARYHRRRLAIDPQAKSIQALALAE